MMKLNRILSLFLITGALFACGAPKKEEVKDVKETKMEKKENTTLGATRFEALNGYFVKNDVAFDKDIEFAVLSSQEDFNKYFGVAKTMENEVTPLDFEKFNVAAIMLKPSKTKNEIKLIRYTSEGAKQIVEFKVEPGAEQSFTSTGLLLFKIPKSRTLVSFNSGTETVEVSLK